MFYKLETPGEFNLFAEDILYKSLERLQTSKAGNINIALSGGQTPIPILKLLKKRHLNWDQYSFFMVDERFVSLEDSSSNFGNIYKVFFQYISSKSYSMVQKDQSISASTKKYSKLIKGKIPNNQAGFPEFDLILLGMGEDGHTASLFPKTKALNETKELVIINDIPQLNTKRITLTFPVLISAKKIIVLAKGQKKRELIHELYSGASPNYPIMSIVKNHTNINWIID